MKNKDEKIYSNEEINSQCPHCGSWKIGGIGKITIVPGGPTYERWTCGECKRGWNMRPEK